MTNTQKSTINKKVRKANTLGRTSREQILQTAEVLLKSEGFHSLSTRKVSDACGISVGNLTYHFPNKVHLVEALMLSVCERYEADRSQVQFNTAKTGSAYLKKTIGWMLDDAVTRETSDLFLELWVLAKHHDFGEEIVERFYETAASWLMESLAQYFPEVSKRRRQRAAYYILTLSEGAVALFSRPSEKDVSQKDIVEFAVNGVLATLTDD